MTATDTTHAQVTRSGTDRRAIPDAALELADILGTIRGLRHAALIEATDAIPDNMAAAEQAIGKGAALRDLDGRISKRIAVLTGRTE